MATLKGLRSRIRSIQETKKITTAMMLVAGAKLRRSQKKTEEAMPFVEHFHKMLTGLSFLLSGERQENILLSGHPKDEVILLLVISADRGLCGSFNISIVREVMKVLFDLNHENKKVLLLSLGKKGTELLNTRQGNLFTFADFLSSAFYVEKDSFKKGCLLAKELIDAYKGRKFDRCLLFYTQFNSILKQTVTIETVLPIPCEYKMLNDKDALYMYEPTFPSFLEKFLPEFIGVRLYNAILQSEVSEQGARMMAMDGATRNAKDMIQKLQLTYNRSRQASITKELIEIISGAEALK